MDRDVECGGCGHTFWDHGEWMGEEREREVSKQRKVGCRIAHCRCEAFVVGPVMSQEYYE